MRKPWWLSWKLYLAATAVLLLAALYFAYAPLGIGILAGLYAALAAFRDARTVADTPPSRVRSAAQGYVRLVLRGSGTDLDGRPIAGPMSDEPCCYWRLQVERLVTWHKGRAWQVEGKAASTAPILPLEDGTGTCHVMVIHADLHSKAVSFRKFDPHLPPALLACFSPAMRPRLEAAARWRVTETRLPADSDLHALGLFESLPSNRSPFARNPVADALQAGADSAMSGLGRGMAAMALDAAAESTATAAAQWQRLMRRLEGIGPEAAPAGTAMAHILVPDRESGLNRPLVLSDRPGTWLARRYRLYALAGLAFALAMAAILFWLLVQEHPRTMAPILDWLGLS